ncbi:MAG: homoserine kinase [Verrucomicrobiales bacterium]|jgi:homoserine kinase|nr:homoserine kinase [Verrucomicrobiales bacterium]
MKPVSVRVPATTANIGPGFDALGIAVQLYNTVTLTAGSQAWPDPFIAEAAQSFFNKAVIKPETFSIAISGDVPRSRGLGSSVTVRLGLIAALNAHYQSPLSQRELLDLVVALEGHPDNAVPACYGGFAVSGKHSFNTVSVDPELQFVTVIPDFEVETKEARKVLPSQISLSQAVENIQNSGLIVSAFTAKKYELLKGVFVDHLHQPYRSKLIPGCEAAISGAEQAGALGAFISGSGSTLMAITLEHSQQVAEAMMQGLKKAGVHQVQSLVLQADNTGLQVL